MDDRLSDQELEVALFWHGGRTGISHEASRYGHLVERFMSRFNERRRLYLGAGAALNSVATASIRYRNGRALHIVPPFNHSRIVAEEVRQICARELVPTDDLNVVTPVALVKIAQECPVLLFDPRQITPELLAYRSYRLGVRVPVVFCHHTISYREQLTSTILPLVLSPSYAWDCIVSPSRAACTAVDNLIEMMTDRMPTGVKGFSGRRAVIPYGVDTDFFRPRNKSQCRKLFNLPQQHFIFLCFGRLSASDKADLLPLLLVHRELRIRNPHVILVIAGNSRDGYKNHLMSEATDRNLLDGVFFLNQITDDEKAYLYGAADVFISLSDNLQESYGVAVIEAMACGIPQVVSDWNGYRDLVDHNVTGFRARSIWGDCDTSIIEDGFDYPKEFPLEHFKLAQSVAINLDEVIRFSEELIKNKDKCQDMARASRRRAKQEYSYPVMMSRFHDLFDELSSEALAKGRREDFSRDVTCPAYYKCFQSYATEVLTDETLVSLRRATDTNPTLPYRNLFNDIELYNEWNIDLILSTIDKERTSIREITERIGSSTRKDIIIRQVLWLLKHGLLVIDQST